MFEARGVGIPHQPDGHEYATRGAGEKLPGRACGLSASPGAAGSGVSYARLLHRPGKTGRHTHTHTHTLFYFVVHSVNEGLNMKHLHLLYL